MTPRRHPRRPKIDPRRLQDDLQELLFSTSFLTSILVPLGSHFGLILAPLGPPNAAPSREIAGSNMTLNDPWRLNAAQDRSKTASRPPKSLPRAAQDPPRPPKDLPRRPSLTRLWGGASLLGPLGPNLGRFGRPRGPKREAKREPRGTKNDTKMILIF